MRIVEQLPPPQDGERKLRRSAANDARFERDMKREVDDSIAAHAGIYDEWHQALRRYSAVPKNPSKNIPIEDAPNIEVALGAIASDAIYAQFLDTMWNISPTVTVRATGKDQDAVADAKALQRRVNHGVASEWGLRPAVEQTVLDNVQLGTGVYYVPFVEKVRKTDIQRVKERGALIQPWPIEDVLVPGGTMVDVQRCPWIVLRSWLTRGELELQAKRSKWDISRFTSNTGKGWVRSQREAMGKTPSQESQRDLYEILHCYAHYDYDEDGEEEDLYAVLDRTSGAAGLIVYNPYDTRPIIPMRYQLRAYVFFGLGVLEMSRSGQEIVSDLMSDALLNVKVANAKVWATKEGTVADDLVIYLNKQIPCQDPLTDIVPKEMGDVHPSVAQYIAMNISLVERRVGVNEMSLPRPSQVLGARTPGITAISLLQQVNRRFTPAFDQMRMATAGAVTHCLYREQERLLAGDLELEQYILKLLGPEDGARVIKLLKDPDFDEAMTVELTASNASVNREADRQASIMLVNVLGSYYERVLQLVQLAANPQLPEPIRDVAKKIATAGGEIIERTLRTFDQIRDPETFIVNVEAEMDAMQDQLNPAGLAGLGGIMGQLAQLGTSNPMVPSDVAA